MKRLTRKAGDDMGQSNRHNSPASSFLRKPDPVSPLMQVRDLTVSFTREGLSPFLAVDKLNFDVASGQTVALVGESGCGKSVTALAIMGLLPARGNQVQGRVEFDGVDLLSLSGPDMARRRGNDLAMVFQDPLSSLNPVVAIGLQVAEVLVRHKGMKRQASRSRAADLLERVGIPDPTQKLRDYPHQLSGGMRQRVMIAMALACEPRLLIADEPTTALDVTIQAQILAILNDLVKESGTALVMITHDLGIVAKLCDEVNVLYAGRIVERAGRYDLFASPRHPYSGGLLGSIPRMDRNIDERLRPIAGSVADNIPWTDACAFAPRCENRIEKCVKESPKLEIDRRDAGHMFRCWNPLQGRAE